MSFLLSGEDVEVAKVAVAFGEYHTVQYQQSKSHDKQVLVTLVVLLELNGGKFALFGLFDFLDNLG